ncbi:MAG: outer membrane protein assembly factor BamD [Candidatus Kapabacteria bacterium]|nr:outer membrane protein assembly factor BamD [Candidatus Kapabacteria bacterium]
MPSTHHIFLTLFALFAFSLFSCSSAEEARKQRTVDDVWVIAKKSYDDGDWLDAQAQLDVIKLQYPASQYADDAQFYLAEINFERGEFILAAFNYGLIRRSYPSSEFVKRAMYKTGLCYDKMSLPADRDQENTRKALQAYSDFQAMFMSDSLAHEAAIRTRVLRDRLAERNWLIAEHYMKTLARRAAAVHLDAIIDDYPDSKWLESAMVLKLKILTFQEKNDDARSLIAYYRRAIKEPKMKAEVDEYEKELP